MRNIMMLSLLIGGCTTTKSPNVYDKCMGSLQVLPQYEQYKPSTCACFQHEIGNLHHTEADARVTCAFELAKKALGK